MEVLGIVPARGGSKGIPDKNIFPVAGKPLIAHILAQAKLTKSITRLVVSTDSTEIETVAKLWGAEVVMRPPDISGDMASSEDALLYTLQFLRDTEGYVCDILAFMQCTSPLTRSVDIDGCIGNLIHSQADSCFVAAPFHYFLWELNEEGIAVGINHDSRFRPLRQDTTLQYREAGSVYAMRTEGFERARHRFFGKTVLYVMPQERCHEIDEPIDIRVAETLLIAQQQKEIAQKDL